MAPTSTSGETPQTSAAAVPPGDSWSQWFRELIAALVSVVILILAAWMLFETFEVGRSKFGVDDKLALDAYSRMKDVLLYVLGFLGTVTGYYLGRIPAEKQADKALQSAAVA